MSDFGKLATLVAMAGNLAAAYFALRAFWAGRGIWEPKIKDFPRAPARLAGLASMVGIAIAFVLTRSVSNPQVIAPWAAYLAGTAIIGFLCDVVARTSLVVRCGRDEVGIVGGLWLTERARQILAGDKKAYKRGDLSKGQAPPGSVSELFCNSGREPDRIWPPSAQAAALLLVLSAYMVWIFSATLGLAVASILMEKTMQ